MQRNFTVSTENTLYLQYTKSKAPREWSTALYPITQHASNPSAAPPSTHDSEMKFAWIFLCIPLNYYDKQYLLTILSMQHYTAQKHQKGQNSYSRRVSCRGRRVWCTRPFSLGGKQAVLSTRHGVLGCRYDRVE